MSGSGDPQGSGGGGKGVGSHAGGGGAQGSGSGGLGAVLSQFPTGTSAKKELKKRLVSSTDPTTTIQEFERSHSLHTMLSKAFGTTPVHQLPGSLRGSHAAAAAAAALGGGGGSSSRASRSAARDWEKLVELKPEPFCPDPALTFLTHLGVARHEIHRRVADALRAALLDEINSTSLPAGKEALLHLLRTSWQFHSLTELRPVLVSLLRKLGDEAPLPVLQRLAEREGGSSKSGGGELKYAELLAQFGLPMRRLVWEADWDGGGGAGGDTATVHSKVGTLRGKQILAEMIRPAVEQYCADADLMQSSNLAFCGTLRDRRLATQIRRAVPGSANTTTTTTPAVATAAFAKGSAAAAANRADSQSGNALAKIRDIIGKRPKLLNAVMSMLIAEHGRNAAAAAAPTESDTLSRKAKKQLQSKQPLETILGGQSYLCCCLVSDILLSYGQLPRAYEHVGILARIMDTAVRNGVISDDVVAQIQGAVRVIFQLSSQLSEKVAPPPPPPPSSTGDSGRGASEVKKPTILNISPAAKKAKEEREFQQRLLRKILVAAVAAMKQADPQGLFLNPVSDDIAPGYSTVIKEPMCIRTIEEKIENQQYSSMAQYERDVNVMFNNCIKYNIGKDGTWFRGEARRQSQVWREEILAQARNLHRTETNKRKRAQEKADGETQRDEKKRKTTKTATTTRTPSPTPPPSQPKTLPQSSSSSSTKPDPPATAKRLPSDDVNFGDKDAIARLTLQDIHPLPALRAKKKKKDQDFPSMPALAVMVLSDPFVVRLLVDKILRSLRTDVLGAKALPCSHRAVPSLLQILHLVQFSPQLCAIRGRRFFVPDVGLTQETVQEDDGPAPDLPYTSLRRIVPLITKLLLDMELDSRMAVGGDLHDLAPTHARSSPADFGSSALCVLRAVVEGAMVHQLQPGTSSDAALLTQIPRLVHALDQLSGQDMLRERSFFSSLGNALLRHKVKLSHSTRDLVVKVWVDWFRVRDDQQQEDAQWHLTSPAHEYFILLLNEWAALGNLILPRDKLLEFAEDALTAASLLPATDRVVRAVWVDNKDCPVKKQYERMLRSVPEARASEWIKRLGLEDCAVFLELAKSDDNPSKP